MITLNGYSSREKFYCPECDKELSSEDPAYEDALLCDVKTSCHECEEKAAEKSKIESQINPIFNEIFKAHFPGLKT